MSLSRIKLCCSGQPARRRAARILLWNACYLRKVLFMMTASAAIGGCAPHALECPYSMTGIPDGEKGWTFLASEAGKTV